MKIEIYSVCLYLISSVFCILSLKTLKNLRIFGIIGVLISVFTTINPSAIDIGYHVSTAFAGLVGATGYLLIVSSANIPVIKSITSVLVIGSIFLTAICSDSWLELGAMILSTSNIVLVCIVIQNILLKNFSEGEKK